MSLGFKFAKYVGIAALSLGTLLPAYADSTQNHTQVHKKTKKQEKPELPPLPSGPTGQKLQPLPLDTISPVLPQVSYENGQLTIVAPNSTLGDILRAVRRQTGAEIEIPIATDRVVTHLGPGPARDVIAELLNGSRFNYVLLGSSEDPSALTRVVLVAKSDTGNSAAGPQGAQQRPNPQQNVAPPPQDTAQDANDADPPEENADENNNADQQQQPEPEQPAAQQGDQSVKTPQELLQEMQQRQLQMQQQGQPQQFPGRPPYPQQQPPQQQQ